MNETNGNCVCEGYEEINEKSGFQINITHHRFLSEKGIKSIYFKKPRDKEVILSPKVEIIPIIYEVRNISTGNYSELYDFKKGVDFKDLKISVIYEDTENTDNLIRIKSQRMEEMARHIFCIVNDFFFCANLKIISMKIAFSKDERGRILFSSNISNGNIEYEQIEWSEKAIENIMLKH